MTNAHEVLFQSTVEHSEKRVVIAGLIEYHDRSLIKTKLLPCDYFNQFVPSSATTGQCYYSITLIGHHLLSFVHAVDNNHLRHFIIIPSMVYHKLRNDTDSHSPILYHCIGCSCHQSKLATTVEQRKFL